MKTPRFIIALMTILGCALTGSAQLNNSSIEVTGTATLNIIPDRITVEIGLEEYFKQSFPDSSRVKIADIEKTVRKVLKKAGVADSAITVTDIGNYRDRGASAKFLQAETLAAVLTDFSQLQEVAANLPERGTSSFRITRLDNSDMAEYNRQGLKAALDAAHEKAKFIAANAGLSLAVPWLITENSAPYEAPAAYSNVAFGAGQGMDNLRRITRRYSVKVVYLSSPNQ